MGNGNPIFGQRFSPIPSTVTSIIILIENFHYHDHKFFFFILGYIDYVRTFTLDKRLEMYVKKTAGRGLPTIVDPELYRKRFCEAMERYFTVVPDKWTGMGADVPEGVI